LSRSRVLAAAACAALALGGCGAAGPSQEDEASGTVEVFLDGCAHDQPDEVADTLTEPLRRELARAGSLFAGCSRLAFPPDEARGANASTFAGAALADLELGYGGGTATVSSPLGDFELELELDGGRWHISSPPPSPGESA
jgi:hypothetical protein